MEDDKIIDGGAHPGNEEKPEGTELTGINDTTSEEHVEVKKKKGIIFRIFRFIFFFIITILFAFGLVIFIIYGVPQLKEMAPNKKPEIVKNKDLNKDANYKKQLSVISKDVQRLSVKFAGYTSGESYIVVNTTENKFYLYKNKQLVREGSCSTGSYKKLQTQSGKSWTFKTPRGKFTIQSKRTHPAWHRPDWSFIEEGAPIPPKDSPLRWEAGVLGDYAMDLGDSYMIHGTIYKRFLGMPVTHGCVRLNDEDLAVVYNTLNVGSKVYIF
jgi:lipoprotein-anchoring transpeptidase ErfK/SrfK